MQTEHWTDSFVSSSSPTANAVGADGAGGAEGSGIGGGDTLTGGLGAGEAAGACAAPPLNMGGADTEITEAWVMGTVMDAAFQDAPGATVGAIWVIGICPRAVPEERAAMLAWYEASDGSCSTVSSCTSSVSVETRKESSIFLPPPPGNKILTKSPSFRSLSWTL